MLYPRLSVNLHQEVAEVLAKMMKKRECSATEAIRQCIVIASAVQEQWAKKGGKVFFQDPDGKLHEVRDLCGPQTKDNGNE